MLNLRFSNWRLAAAIGYATLLVTATHLPAKSLPPTVTIGDKLVHLGCYAILGLLAFSAAAAKSSAWDWKRFGQVAAGLVAFAALDESTQYFAPGRVPDVFDWVANVCGIFCGGWLYAQLRHVRSLWWTPNSIKG